MKRKVSELEEKLIMLGFVLESKTYYGKHSQFVKHYVYRGTTFIELSNGEKMSVPTKVYLDRNREKVEEIKIANFLDYWCGGLATTTLNECHQRVEEIIRYWEKNDERTGN